MAPALVLPDFVVFFVADVFAAVFAPDDCVDFFGVAVLVAFGAAVLLGFLTAVARAGFAAAAFVACAETVFVAFAGFVTAAFADFVPVAFVAVGAARFVGFLAVALLARVAAPAALDRTVDAAGALVCRSFRVGAVLRAAFAAADVFDPPAFFKVPPARALDRGALVAFGFLASPRFGM